jgi:hypothetical protein
VVEWLIGDLGAGGRVWENFGEIRKNIEKGASRFVVSLDLYNSNR